MTQLKTILLLGIAFILNSCFIADDAFGVYKEPKMTLKQKTQNAITEYIKTNSKNDKYFSYGYSELIIHKPEALIELDKLKARRKIKSVNQIELEKDIAALEQKIKNNNIRYTMEMDHIFSLTNKTNGNIELYETRFFIADTLKVFDLKPLMNIPLSNEQETIFADYFYESTIFITPDYTQARSLSKQFYAFFKVHQDELLTLKEKSDFLTHTLWLCNEVKSTGAFNQAEILQKLAKQKLTLGKFIDYEPIKFSTLYEINEGENLKGYYFFHKFSHFNNNREELSVAYIGFSPYYELNELRLVEAPYKPYFDE